MNSLDKDKVYMRLALNEAKKASEIGEIPVGCVIVYQDQIIAKAHNKRHQTKSVFEHAEIMAIKKANKKMQAWILEDVTLYVTLEPCLMCSGAILQSRIKRVVYGAKEPKFGALGSVINVFDGYKFNHQVEYLGGVLEKECSEIMRNFFQNLRVDKMNKK